MESEVDVRVSEVVDNESACASSIEKIEASRYYSSLFGQCIYWGVSVSS